MLLVKIMANYGNKMILLGLILDLFYLGLCQIFQHDASILIILIYKLSDDQYYLIEQS